MLHAQKRAGIKILRAVRIEVDRRHDENCVDRQLPIAADRLPSAELGLRLALQPVRRLLHGKENVAGNEQPGDGADGRSDNHVLVTEQLVYAYAGLIGSIDYRIYAGITFSRRPTGERL